LFEESVRAPLIIVAPRARGNGKATPRVSEFVDLYPTLAELCSIPAPAGLAGRSLRPLLDAPQRAWNHPAFTIVTRGKITGRSVRTERWRYNEWDEGRAGVELYDHHNDPREQTNLANNPQRAATVVELQRLLRSIAQGK